MIVFVLRHADRTAGDDLSPAGERRAELLARMIGDTAISAAFRTQFVRAAKTLRPLQARLPGLPVREIRFDDDETVDDYAWKVAVAVRALPFDAAAVVVGHSNTVGATIAQLGGGQIAPIEESEFDKLFVVFTAPSGTSRLVRMRYGEPT